MHVGYASLAMVECILFLDIGAPFNLDLHLDFKALVMNLLCLCVYMMCES